MSDALDNAIEILGRLVSFQSYSGRPTHGIVGYVQDYLTEQGVEVTLSYDEAGERANVFATIGPQIDGGVVLNGHTDVVSVEGCLLYTSPSPRDRQKSRMPSSA